MAAAQPAADVPPARRGDADDDDLLRVPLGTETLTETLERVARSAQRRIPGVDEVSVTLVDGDRARTAVFTGDLAVQLDERQYEAGFGPCLDAARSGLVVEVPDTRDDGTYPDFTSQARRSGVTRSLAVALPVAGRPVGALNCYAFSGHGWTEDTVEDARAFAGVAAVVLANSALYADSVEESAQLRAAMASRAVIEQAKGIVVALHRCSPEEAFVTLRRISATTNRKLRDVAHELVERRGLDD